MGKTVEVDLLPHQHEFCSGIMNDGFKESAIVGGIRSGKTFVGAVMAAVLSNNFDCPGLICANTYGQLRDSTLLGAEAAWDRMGIRHAYNENKKYVYLDGRRHFYRSLETFDNLRGVEAGWAWYDEASYGSLEAYKVVLGRLSHEKGPRVIFLTMTGRGKNWIQEYFIDDVESNHTLAKTRHIMIGISTDSNTALPKDYLDLIKGSYSGRFASQEIGGQLVDMEGSIFNIPESQYIDYEPNFENGYEVAIDFGRRRPAVLFIQEFEHGKDVIYDAALPERPNGILIDDLCNLVDMHSDYYPITIYVDPAGDSGNTHTYETDISVVKRRFPESRIKYTFIPSLRRKETQIAVLDNRFQKRQLFISKKLRKRKPGEYTSVITAFQDVSHPKEKSGKPVSNTFEKDGLLEHPIDAACYWGVNKYPPIKSAWKGV